MFSAHDGLPFAGLKCRNVAQCSALTMGPQGNQSSGCPVRLLTGAFSGKERCKGARHVRKRGERLLAHPPQEGVRNLTLFLE